MKNSLLVIVCYIITVSGVSAQYGHEWINPTQPYIKIEIAEENFYRVDASDLAPLGLPLSSMMATRFQLFRRGKEVAIATVENPDGTLQYLEFYGQANDGALDASLYESNAQLHPYLSLFTDTAVYFLTYSSTLGKRITTVMDMDSIGLVKSFHHWQQEDVVEQSQYNGGIKFGSSSDYQLSDYSESEGWTGPFFGKNRFRDFNFVLTDRMEGTSLALSGILVGGNSLSHKVQILAGTSSSSLNTIQTELFEGWGSTTVTASIEENYIASDGQLAVRMFDEGFAGVADRVSVAFLSVSYPQTLTLMEGENKTFNLRRENNPKAWVFVNTSSGATNRFYDITDPENVEALTSVAATKNEIIHSFSADVMKLMGVSTTQTPPKIQSIRMPELDFDEVDYLIITHKELRQNEDPVVAYKNYRESDIGGSYTVSITDIDDIYNVFHYGEPSSLAIKNFIRYVHSISPLKNVFIIGKGYTPDYNFYRKGLSQVNIPTYGAPGTDLMYTLDLETSEDYPQIPVGRINATSPEDIVAYLNKIKEMEVLPFDALWRKNFLHLSGGATIYELPYFASVVQRYGVLSEEKYIGGKTFNTGKETANAVEFINIVDKVNEGVGFITFFGHSSGTVTDIEIGRVSDPSFGYANKVKYPLFLVNGCQAGEIYGERTQNTFGEDWILTPDLGAVCFLAHTSTASTSNLDRWSTLFYQVAFGDTNFIKATIGEALVEVSKRFIENYTRDFGLDDFALSQVQQMLIQGDPAYNFFGAEYPDFDIEEDGLDYQSIDGEVLLASQDSFKLCVPIKNYGITSNDSIHVQITRSLVDGDQEQYFSLIPPVKRLDTLTFFIKNDSQKNNVGINKFDIVLDYPSKINELDETNNTASIEFYMYESNTVNLLPQKFAVVPSDTITFFWQSSNLLEEARTYSLAFSTNENFQAPYFETINIDGEQLISHSFDFSDWNLEDSTVIFWRTKFANPKPEEADTWSTSSFTIFKDGETGWGQFVVPQFETNETEGVYYDENTSRWEFEKVITSLNIFTFGSDHPSLGYEDISMRVDGVDFMITSVTLDPFCRNNTLNAVVFDKETGKPKRPIHTTTIDVFNREVCGRLPQQIYNFTQNDLLNDARRRLQVLVDAMNEGDWIVFFNIGEVNFSGFDATVLNTFTQVGVATSDLVALTDGQPAIIIAKKGEREGFASFITSDISVQPREQSLTYEGEIFGNYSSARIVTSPFGPVHSWKKLYYDVESDENDALELKIINHETREQLFLIDINDVGTHDLSTIDASIHPTLSLSITMQDTVALTPPQIQYWTIQHENAPEGVLMLSGEASEKSSLQRGEPFEMDFYFVNYSNVDFEDSLIITSQLIHPQSGAHSDLAFEIPPVFSGDTGIIHLQFETNTLVGSYDLTVQVIPQENEVYNFNNTLYLSNAMEVSTDLPTPVMDVTFDGIHIINGDIISPNPLIEIMMKETSEFSQKNDTLGINIWFKGADELDNFERVSFSDTKLTYYPASENRDFVVEYSPGGLPDGQYALRAQVSDEFGNKSGEDPYEIEFEVINQTSITHFYPYPNPFSTNCRFIFTLTGAQIPDEIKIQIMNVSGQVVREITQDEIGNIKIGNNITEYAWDGKDEFNDQLANGVYFYKAIVFMDGNPLDHRVTSAEKGFKNNIGKLYLLR